jgi:hypothetical protein
MIDRSERVDEAPDGLRPLDRPAVWRRADDGLKEAVSASFLDRNPFPPAAFRLRIDHRHRYRALAMPDVPRCRRCRGKRAGTAIAVSTILDHLLGPDHATIQRTKTRKRKPHPKYKPIVTSFSNCDRGEVLSSDFEAPCRQSSRNTSMAP